MVPLLFLLAKRHGEHLIDYIGLTFLLSVWAAGVHYSDFSGVLIVARAALESLG